MQPYPAIMQSDPAQQQFAQMLGGYKPNQLGAGVTLGNPQAQQDYIAQLAQALADGEFSAKQIEQAGSMLTPEFIQNSGLAGVADMMLKTYVGKKMDEKGRTLQADAEARRMTAQEGVDERKAEKDAARSEAVSNRERTRREAVARKLELNNREAVEFVETGKVPEAKRDRLQALEGVNGPGIVNLDQGTVRYAQPEDAQPEGYKVTYAPGASAEDRAAVDAAARAAGWPSDPHGDVVDVGRVRPQPPGQFITAAAAQRAQQNQRQAAADARAEEALQLARRGADRADNALTFQRDQAAKKEASAATKPNAMRQDAINFAAAYIGKKPEDVAKMTPEQIRTAVASGNRTMTGPVMGRIPGNAALFNADLEAYANSAAGKKARLNNPTGPVSNADFEIARKSVFSAEKPDAVNADLIYQALTDGAAPTQAAPVKPAQPGHVLKFNPQTGKIE